MQPKDIINIVTLDDFYAIRNQLNLTDRQKEIFYLKYSRGLRNIDIAETLNPPVCQDTVSSELKIIRTKLAKFSLDNHNNL